MNITEAVKSGKWFRRKDSKNWLRETKDGLVTPEGLVNHAPYFNLFDIKADDWEIDETKVVVTETKFLKAWKSAIADNHTNHELYESLKRHLGLQKKPG